ncbi:hypothetical protein XPR_2129 [Xanthomonas arboricola pv. pruni MAFF 301420]|uniref:Uncharacterized protein n=1 Tax=Xanthomonas arboricola pv. pruni MAFF 301420 TaxID=1418095 RepID=W4SHS5_9XANT|nr:hypothetical protein XPR_2129 [Xanthomonas arboricola pv. pruni MAFF 301420]
MSTEPWAYHLPDRVRPIRTLKAPWAGVESVLGCFAAHALFDNLLFSQTGDIAKYYFVRWL